MSSALRLCSLLGSTVASKAPTSKLLLTSTAAAARLVQPAASIVSVAKQDASFVRPTPFDYKNKTYTVVHKNFTFLDPTHLRFNPNSKIVIVEGNMCSGKEVVAQKLADAFGWAYLKEPRIEDYYINHNGFDYRTLNQYVNEPKLHAVDEKMFYENPKHAGVSWMKIFYYRQRYSQYIDALAHLFNTGQGVVLERSPFSEFVFAEAMYKCGWLPRDTYDYYFRLRYDTVHGLLRPHLVIYLDVDPEVSLKRIKERNVPHEVNSPVLTKEYLTEIDQAYKTKYLPDIGQFSELLLYKWNTPAESLDDMILNIEDLEMDDWDVKGLKFKDWNLYWNSMYDEVRYTYTSEKVRLMDDFVATPIWDVDSLTYDLNDAEHRDQVYESFVKNYGVEPDWDANRVGLFRSIFAHRNPRMSDNFQTSGPFF